MIPAWLNRLPAVALAGDLAGIAYAGLLETFFPESNKAEHDAADALAEREADMEVAEPRIDALDRMWAEATGAPHRRNSATPRADAGEPGPAPAPVGPGHQTPWHVADLRDHSVYRRLWARNPCLDDHLRCGTFPHAIVDASLTVRGMLDDLSAAHAAVEFANSR